MNRILRALVALSVLVSGACVAQPPFARMEAATGTLDLPAGGVCSATAVGPHVIATAGHCVADNPKELRFRGLNMLVVSITLDGKDHALVRMDGDVSPYVKQGTPPKQGDTVWLYGNPAGFPQLLRQGFIEKVQDDQTFLWCHCDKGDSGAGIFNAKGEWVAVYTGQYEMRDMRTAFPAFFPLAFTAKDWDEARK